MCIRDSFTLDGLFKKVKAYIQTCDSCQRYKDTNNRMLFGGTKEMIPSARGDIAVSYTHLDVYKRQAGRSYADGNVG